MHSTTTSVLSDSDPKPIEVFHAVGRLILEGRIPGLGPRGFGEGVHCSQYFQNQSKSHTCCMEEGVCLKDSTLRKHLTLLHANSIPLVIEVLLAPDCQCTMEKGLTPEILSTVPDASYVLLEQWTVATAAKDHNSSNSADKINQSKSSAVSADKNQTYTAVSADKTKNLGKSSNSADKINQSKCSAVSAVIVPPKVLLQILRSHLHFSQLAAWLTASRGKNPKNVIYRVTVPGERFGSKFKSDDVVEHEFPVGQSESCGGGIKVHVKSLPRTFDSIPLAHCSNPRCKNSIIVDSDDDAEDNEQMKNQRKSYEHIPQKISNIRYKNGENSTPSTTQIYRRNASQNSPQFHNHISRRELFLQQSKNHKNPEIEDDDDDKSNRSHSKTTEIEYDKSHERNRSPSKTQQIDDDQSARRSRSPSKTKEIDDYKSTRRRSPSKTKEIDDYKSTRRRSPSKNKEIDAQRTSPSTTLTTSLITAIKPLPPSPSSKLKFRKSLHSAASMVFHGKTGLPLTSSPAPLRKGQSKFEFDGEIQRMNLNSHNQHCQHAQRLSSTSSQLLGSFEESVLRGRIEPVSTIEGFSAEIGASGSFCPQHLHLPVTVFFYTFCDNDKVSTPYLAHINLASHNYQIPRKGTLQVTLFNPLRTVIKMFVILYDFSDMPPNSRTFLRQRILYMPVEQGESESDFSTAHPTRLRYLIHLRFASSKSGKIYLHTDLRIIIFRKADADTAVGHGNVVHELRSFTEMPVKPKYSKDSTSINQGKLKEEKKKKKRDLRPIRLSFGEMEIGNINSSFEFRENGVSVSV